MSSHEVIEKYPKGAWLVHILTFKLTNQLAELHLNTEQRLPTVFQRHMRDMFVKYSKSINKNVQLFILIFTVNIRAHFMTILTVYIYFFFL